MCKLEFFDYECDSIVDVSDSVLCKLSAFLDYQKDLFAKGKYWGQADLQNENLIFSCFRLSDVFGLNSGSTLKNSSFQRKIVAENFQTRRSNEKVCKRAISRGERNLQNWVPFVCFDVEKSILVAPYWHLLIFLCLKWEKFYQYQFQQFLSWLSKPTTSFFRYGHGKTKVWNSKQVVIDMKVDVTSRSRAQF